MISVKDKDVADKRQAIQQTIELHKKINELRPNAVFTSNVKRGSGQFEGTTTSTFGDVRTAASVHSQSKRTSLGAMFESQLSRPG